MPFCTQQCLYRTEASVCLLTVSLSLSPQIEEAITQDVSEDKQADDAVKVEKSEESDPSVSRRGAALFGELDDDVRSIVFLYCILYLYCILCLSSM